MSKLERLLNLTAALLETGRPLTASEIRDRVPGYPQQQASFHRAFERDKDDLREMGVPLELIPVPGTDPPLDGYRIPKQQYYLRDPELESDELAALHLAAAAVRLDGIQGLEGLWKLGGRPRPAPDAAPDNLLAIPTDSNLVPLFAALTERRPAGFDYRGEPRRVEPHRLEFRRGRWYLTGWDRARDAERNFRVDRIEGSVELGEPGAFERPTDTGDTGRAPWELGDGAPVRVRLLVDADQALWAVRHLGAEAISEERPDGSVVFTIPVTNRPAFRSFVITFLDHAEILEPLEVRAELVEWLEELAA